MLNIFNRHIFHGLKGLFIFNRLQKRLSIRLYFLGFHVTHLPSLTFVQRVTSLTDIYDFLWENMCFGCGPI